jgi:hypothetical protein
MTENNKFTGIRAEGEGDRSQEFKDAREKLVESINDYLTGIAAKRDAGEVLADGTVITDKPRLVRSFIGKTAAGMDMIAEDRKKGVSLEGDGVTSKLRLQAFMPHDSGTGAVISEVEGSDPLERQFSDRGYSSHGHLEKVVTFTVTDVAPEQAEHYFGYDVMGDGAVHRRFVTDSGVHTGATLRTTADIQLATEAFSTVQSQFNFAQE